jgi:adenosine deaminase
MSLESYVRAAPKAELHVHLEGSIQPATLLTLSRRNGVALPADSEDGLRRWFTYRDFDHFIEIYMAVSSCLRTSEDYELITYALGNELAQQNVRYAEVTFTPATHGLRLGVPHDAYFGGLTRGRQRVRADFGVEINWVFDFVHNIDDPPLNRTGADYTTRIAIEGKDDGVVALGLGGPEVGHSFENIATWFDQARAAGLHSAPHAGETRGPASIWGALRVLGAERIGHGVRAIEDPELVAYLAEAAIPLEVCPTSNLCLGVYPSLAEHPLPRLHAAGVPLTINSDDPPLFNTSLNEEAVLLGIPFGLDVAAIDTILLNGVQHSFLPLERKKELAARHRRELAALKAEHLKRLPHLPAKGFVAPRYALTGGQGWLPTASSVNSCARISRATGCTRMSTSPCCSPFTPSIPVTSWW